jgi:GTPase Era involved in 16S rRNA processing
MRDLLHRWLRNWRSRSALKKCAAISGIALNDAEAALVDAEKQAGAFINTVSAAAEINSQDGTVVEQARQVLKDRTLALSLSLQTEISTLRTALARKRNRAGCFTVTLFGKTTAGKSTIREAVTGGDGTTIGKGGQRTTRDVLEYQWQGITILDTPGFGAPEGQEDRELAFSTVDESDVIVFLLSSNELRAKENSIEMKALNRLHKHVVFVVNVKQDLKNIAVHRRNFMADPSWLMGDAAIQPHRNGIATLVRKHAPWMAHKLRVVAVHAQAAWMARQPENIAEASRLLAGSNINQLLHLLEDELHLHGTQRRVDTIIGGTERALAFVSERLSGVSTSFREEAALLEEKHTELKTKLDDFTRRFPDRCRIAVQEHFGPLERGLGKFVEENLGSSEFDKRWKALVAARNKEGCIKRFVDEIAEELAAIVREFWRQVQVDAEFTSEFHGAEATSADPVDWKKVVRRVGIVLGIAATVLALTSNPGGWAVGIASLLTGISSFFVPGKSDTIKKAKEEARTQLAAQIEQNAAEVAQSLQDWFTREIEEKTIAPLHTDIAGLTLSINTLANAAAKLSATICAGRDALLSRHPIPFPGYEPQTLAPTP